MRSKKKKNQDVWSIEMCRERKREKKGKKKRNKVNPFELTVSIYLCILIIPNKVCYRLGTQKIVVD